MSLQQRITVTQCQRLVDGVTNTRLDEPPAEFAAMACHLIGEAETQVDLALLLRHWLLVELEPVSLRGRKVRHTDFSDVTIRGYLALALPLDVLEAQRFESPDIARLRSSDQLAAALNVDISTLYRIQRQTRMLYASALHAKMVSGADWYAQFVDVLCFSCASRQRLTRADWHRQQAALREVETNGLAAAWHLYHAGDWDDLVVRLHRRAYEIALESEPALAPSAQDQLKWFVLHAPTLKHASRLQRILACQHDAHNNVAARHAALEMAVRMAVQSKDFHTIANSYLDLARFYAGRDADRAEGFYRRCIELFELIPDVSVCAEDYCYALIQYALFQTQKYNSSAIGLMRRAERLPLPTVCQARANLWLEWGTIEWRVGNYAGAIERYADAAAIYEGLNDQVNLRTATFNLGLCHLSMQRYDLALRSLSTVIDGSEKSAASVADRANWMLTRADCFRHLDQFDKALAELARAREMLDDSQEPRLVASVFDLVARTHFRCFKLTGRIEHQLDCASAAAALYALENRHPYVGLLASRLRADLAAPDIDDRNQARFVMTNPEHAANFAEISEIDRLREQTIAGQSPAERLNAKLGIARIYLELSIRERQAALDYAEQHNLRASTTEAVLAMADRHERTLNSHDRLFARWQEHSRLDASLIQSLLSHFEQHGNLTKKAYIMISGVSAATASRVLARLLAVGLIAQHGAGASSRYTLVVVG